MNSAEGFALQCYSLSRVSVCVCVCLSVPALAASASVETSKQRYSRVSLRLMCGVSKKPSVQKLWREKANMQCHRLPLSRSFGTNETQQLREGQLVGRMMLLLVQLA